MGIIRRSTPIATLAIAILAGSAAAHHPHDPIDAFALNPLYPEIPLMLLASDGSYNVMLRSSDHARTWQEARQGLVGRAATAFSFAPDWPDTPYIYAITGIGGLQVSWNGGRSWSVPFEDHAKLQFLEVASEPVRGRSVFYAGQDTLFAADPVLPGEEIVHVVGTVDDTGSINAMAISPRFGEDETIVLATNDGSLLISENAGDDWTTIAMGWTAAVLAVSPGFPTDRTIWVGTTGRGILRSTDAGQTFTAVNGGLTDLFVTDIAVAPTYPAPADLWVTTRDEGVLHSSNGGDSWAVLGLSVKKTNQTDIHYRRVHISPSWPSDQTLYCASFEGLYASFDGGVNWKQANINPTRMGRFLSISPDFAADGKVFGTGYGMQVLESNDGGDSWSVEFTDYEAISTYSLAVSPTFADDQLVLAGVGNGIRRSLDGGLTWQGVVLAPHDTTAYYNSIRSIVYSSTFASDQTVYASANGGIYRSTDAGVSWVSYPPPIVRAWKMVISPDFANDSTLFVAGPGANDGVMRSVDGGASFTAPSGDVASVTTLAIDPDFATTHRLWIASSSIGVKVSTDRGESWAPLGVGFEGTSPVRLIPAKQFSSNSTMVATTQSNGIWESTDAGVSWNRLDPDSSPVTHASSLAISPDYPDVPILFAGTFEGIFRSVDRGATWVKTTHEEVYDDRRDEPIIPGGVWSRTLQPGCINLGMAESTRIGSSLILPFDGDGVSVIGSTGPDHGTLRIFLEGTELPAFDAYSATNELQRTLAEISGLDPGFHWLRVEVAADKNPLSTGHRIGIDAFNVTYP
ncbi:MAG: hypothetical protein CME06_13180 [Gemmatimonadetes bacterium]|nr:hypothetical protein [Gemmatimonadota bacterium]